jgi:hypothetical protein
MKLAKRDRMNFLTILLFFKNSMNFISEPVPARLWSTEYSSLNRARFCVFQTKFLPFSVCSVSTACGECRNISIVSLDESIQMFAPRPRSLKIRENDFTSQNILAWRLRVSGHGSSIYGKFSVRTLSRGR